MKGPGDGKGSLSTALKKHTVNDEQWAREAVAKLDCQERVDAKAFTGRGKLRDLRQLIASLDVVQTRMEELATASKQLNGAAIYLIVHHRNSSGYTFLRWRERGGSNRHLSWPDVEKLIQTYPRSHQQWVRAASALADELNGEHLEHRKAIKAARVRILRTVSHTFARPIPVKQV